MGGLFSLKGLRCWGGPGVFSGVPAGDIAIDIDGAGVGAADGDSVEPARWGGASAGFFCTPADGPAFLVDGAGVGNSCGEGFKGALCGRAALSVGVATPAVYFVLVIDSAGMSAPGGDGDEAVFWRG